MADEVASSRYGLLLICRGLDSAGWDGAIRHVTGTEAYPDTG
jgi:polyphosphate kinase 2 (PPK2 family)